MQQSVEVLLLALPELQTAIDVELQNNPLLEIDEEKEAAQESSQLDSQVEQILKVSDLPYFQEGVYDDTLDDIPINRPESLEDSLLKQLRVDVNSPQELRIGEMIIGNINEDGYLTISCEEIAKILQLDAVAAVENVLTIIQGFDPLGIASRDLQECLLRQIPVRLNGNAALATRIVTECLPELGKRKFQLIARKLRVSVDTVKNTARLIASLDPRPARNFRPVQASIYIRPDATIIAKEDNQYEVLVSHEGVPALRINQTYKRLIKDKTLSQEEKGFLRERLQNAVLFMRSVQQRGNTIKEITTYLLQKQRGFFDQGHEALVPMTLKDVAQALDRNESTISRAINKKYLDTPRGIIPFKFFFSQALENGEPGNHVSNRSIKEEIKELIEREDKASPLSDSDIQDHFTRRGLKIARRTVAKYRNLERILPSHLRKQ